MEILKAEKQTRENHKKNCDLELVKFIKEYKEDELRCDGCGVLFEEGDFFISGITSCCGGCSRVLCEMCILNSYEMIEDRKNNKEKEL